MAILSDGHPAPLAAPASGERLLGWLTTVGHKRIGLLYLLIAAAFFLLAGLQALNMRLQLAVPRADILGPGAYNAMFTMHGTTMIFLVGRPVLLGYANYFVPLQIGARDLAFPKLNALSYWLLLFGGAVLYFSFPDWYFLWLFALLAYAPPAIEGLVIVGLPLVLGIALLAVPLVAPAGERAPERRPWAVAIVVFATLSFAVLIYEGYRSPWAPELHATIPPGVIANLTGPTQRGAVLFQEKGCLACHVIAGSGGQRGPALAGDRLSADQLTWRILYGGNNMPAYGTILQPDEVTALVDFLQSRRSVVNTPRTQ
ncbi:MAG: cbb3-type cytochrome c oxidase subunit I [Chloroflexi bacterium]|nr:cbb3-type cytochrome c oxidase subunit I [Chloroflexota bacterium]